MTFLKFSFDLFIQEVRIIHENASTFFKNECYTLSSSYSSTIFNISTTINTPTTMNTQFEALNAQILIFTPPISFHMHKNYISFNSSLYSSKPSPPPPKILILSFVRFIDHSSSWFLIINEWVAFVVKFCFLREAKKVLSLVQGMKSNLFPDLFVKKTFIEDFYGRLLIVEDLYGKSYCQYIRYFCNWLSMCFLETDSLEVFQIFFLNKKIKMLVLQLTELCQKFDLL